MKYFVATGGREFVIDVDGENVVVDGVPCTARVERRSGSPEIHLVVDGVATNLGVESSDPPAWRLVDRGAVHDVTAEDERSRHVRLLAGVGKVTGGPVVLKAPMPGLVLRVAVGVGDLVDHGTGLVTLEAMKMENELKAAGSGVVVAVLVTAGQTVQKGEVLLEIGPQEATTAAPDAG